MEDRLDDVSFDPISLAGFTPTTKRWIAELAGQLDGGDHREQVSVETAASLFFILRILPDDEFPGGKWATIQYLEALIGETVSAGLKAAVR